MITKYYFRFLWFGLVLCLSCVTGPSASWGQSLFSGVYTGTLFSACDPDDGEFAILVKANNTALVLSFDPLDEEAGHIEGVNINANGSFSHTDVEDGFTTVINGTFTPTAVSGTYVVNGVCSGTFNGNKLPSTGELREVGGFYSGSMSGTVSLDGSFAGTFSGDLFMILSANGVSFMVFEGSASAQGVVEPVEVGVLQTGGSADNICGSVNLGSISATCNFDPSTLTFTGTFSVPLSGGTVSGNWSLTRRVPLPNNAPVAANDSYIVLTIKTLIVDGVAGVLANDSDPDGDSLTTNLVAGPSDGTLTLDPDGGFIYEPNRGFSGTDDFTYRASDGLASSSIATVMIIVEPIKTMPWLGLLLLDD